MARRSFSIAAATALCLAACLGLAACDSGAARSGDSPSGVERSAPLSAQDAVALAELGDIATRDAAVDGNLAGAECWAPTAHRIAGETAGDFRVLCRVHYDQRGEQRYRDMICIGDLAGEPVAESCYQWAFYTDTPVFEDHPAYPAGSGVKR